MRPQRRALTLVLVILAGTAAASQPVAHAQGETCAPRTVTTTAVADAWVDENSTDANKGSDALLRVGAQMPANDTRSLVRFPTVGAAPAGCVVESARLRLYSDSGSAGSKVEALRLAAAWTEGAVSWSNQPATTGAGVLAWSMDGYMQWNVTPLVAAGADQGFLLRDPSEDREEGGAGHGFYAREKGENPPQLVIRYAAPPSGEPAPPAPPAPAAVRCGDVLTESTLVINDLSECLGDGLVIGAPRIIVDLGGHTIDGTGLGTGVRNDGYESVQVRNGTVRDFDRGVYLLPETRGNVLERLRVEHNEIGGIELFDATDNEIRDSLLDENGDAIALVSGTARTLVADNVMTLNRGAGLLLQDSDGNRLERNTVSGGGDLGVGLEHSSDNVVLGNSVSANSDGGMEIELGSNRNLVEGNVLSESGDTGILVSESDGNRLIANTTRLMSDSGITLNTANDGVVRANTVGSNPGGLQIDGSSRNLVEGNEADGTSGIGIELGGGSYDNDITGNTANGNAAQGIYVADEALIEPGNRIVGNTADDNGADGIALAKGGHTLTANVTRGNRGWGINAGLLNTDGGRNVASGNGEPGQCLGIVCLTVAPPPPDLSRPDTFIVGTPETGDGQATIAFAGADDRTPQEALRFECRLDEQDWVPCVSPATFAGVGPGNHRFEVRAIDAAGNADASPASFAWTEPPRDVDPPDTSIDSGPAPESSSTTAAFAFSSDESGTTFECSLDGGAFSLCASPIEYRSLALGTHRLEVRAIDAAGNADATPASFAWSVVEPPDTRAPETAIEAGPERETSSSVARFEFSADEPGSSFECSLDGAEFGPCASGVEYSGLSLGGHSFEVRAIDAAGNADASPAGYGWSVVEPPDTRAPETAIDAGPERSTDSTDARFEFSSDEAGSSFECALDGAGFGPCESPLELTGLNSGAHTISVRATDAAGNVDPSPATYGWTVVEPPDTRAPDTTIESGPPAETSNTTAQFEFSSSEVGSSFECSLDGAAFGPCVSGVEYSGLPLGDHRFEVRATDVAGNVDASPASYAWSVVAPPDETAPETSIDVAPPGGTTDTTTTFEFSSSEQGSFFECSLDGAAFAPCTSPLRLTDLAVGRHELRVRAIDAAGNADASPASHEWSVVAPPDTAPPETSIDSSPEHETTSTLARFEFGSTEAGSSFECSVDGAAFGPCASGVEYSGLALGGHSFEVRAIDTAGNVDPSPATYDWIVVEPPDETAPETSIGSGPPAASSDTTARFEFSSDEGGSSFECSLDGAAFRSCASGVEYSALALGDHRFEVRATDVAGNVDASPASYAWSVVAPPDETAPETSIDVAPPGETAETTAMFEFFSSEQGSSFECSLDGAAFAACPSPLRLTGLAVGRHELRVRAIDAAGNADASPASHTWIVVEPPDTTAPDTSIESGPPAASSDTTARFEFSSTEAGSSYECSLDGAAFGPCASGVEYSALGLGDHRFEVRATDAAGNTDATPAGYGWSVVLPPDTAAPETSIDVASPGETTDTTTTFEFSSSEAGSSFECSLDGAAFAACTSPLRLTGLAVGRHELRVQATDSAGNTDPTPASHGWSIVAPPDETAPETSIDSGPERETTSTKAGFEFSSSEAGSSFECSLDGAAFGPCASGVEYSGLALGDHRFEVRATDAAGNSDATPAGYAWSIVPPPDTTAPETTIDAGPERSSESTVARFEFSSDDGGSSFECALDGGGFGPCESPLELTGLSPGAHVLQVRAVDAAGNRDATPATYEWTVLEPRDTRAPETTIVSGPSGETTSTTARFEFAADEAGARFECSLDGAPFAGCASPLDLEVLTVGSHEVRIRAIDAAGNVDGTPASRSWTVVAPPPPCTPRTVTLTAAADTWVLQSSLRKNYGNDGDLKVDSKSRDNARALVRFELPPVPAGCRVQSAALSLYAASYKSGRTLEAVRLGSAWAERQVTWATQPAPVGATATVSAGQGYREWTVTTQVEAMYATANHGFLIRDAAESSRGFEQVFQSREKGDERSPRLVVTFGPPETRTLFATSQRCGTAPGGASAKSKKAARRRAQVRRRDARRRSAGRQRLKPVARVPTCARPIPDPARRPKAV